MIQRRQQNLRLKLSTIDQKTNSEICFVGQTTLDNGISVGVQVELASPDFRIDDVLSASAVQALRGFSSLANRSVLHPLDRERWNRFLGMAHREQALLTSDMLQRWLVEEEKWPEDKAFDLTVEYEHARGLLKTYEAQQA